MSIPKSHRAIVITGAGGPEVLEFVTADVPAPGPGQILIRIHTAGVNRHDCNQRAAGAHHDGTAVPGLEASGTVAAKGEGVTHFQIGDPVMALLQGGGYAQFAVADQALVMRVPDTITLTEAAGLPEALFTAWWNFFGLLMLQPDETAMIHGGTSGVGHLALQALSALGYKVLATAGRAEKVEAARAFGAAAAFDYHDPDLAEHVMSATQGGGVNVLLDMSAGAHVAADIAMMAIGGRIGHLSPGHGDLHVPLRSLMAKRVKITGSLLRPLALSEKSKIATLIRRDVLPLVGNQVRPAIAAVFPISEAALAHAEMEKGSHIGKILLSVVEQ